MPTLDLHGVRHFDAEIMVEDFILQNETPFDIITGNSEAMKSIVKKALGKHDLFGFHKNLHNLGRVTVTDKIK